MTGTDEQTGRSSRSSVVAKGSITEVMRTGIAKQASNFVI
jgi:hypothetical protein